MKAWRKQRVHSRVELWFASRWLKRQRMKPLPTREDFPKLAREAALDLARTKERLGIPWGEG